MKAERRDLIDPRPEPASAQPGPGSHRARPRHSFASDVVGATLIMLLLGVWLIVSPLVLPYDTGDDGVWLPLAAGALIALAAILRMTGVRTRALNFFVMAVGIALVIGGFLVAENDWALWNAIGGAAIAIFLASASAGAVEESRATGGRGY